MVPLPGHCQVPDERPDVSVHVVSQRQELREALPKPHPWAGQAALPGCLSCQSAHPASLGESFSWFFGQQWDHFSVSSVRNRRWSGGCRVCPQCNCCKLNFLNLIWIQFVKNEDLLYLLHKSSSVLIGVCAGKQTGQRATTTPMFQPKDYCCTRSSMVFVSLLFITHCFNVSKFPTHSINNYFTSKLKIMLALFSRPIYYLNPKENIWPWIDHVSWILEVFLDNTDMHLSQAQWVSTLHIFSFIIPSKIHTATSVINSISLLTSVKTETNPTLNTKIQTGSPSLLSDTV